MKRLVVLLAVGVLSGGCATSTVVPGTMGETLSGYTYVPIDPFPVETVSGEGCAGASTKPQASLLASLPDNAVRMMVEQFDASGKVTYGPAVLGAKGESYRVTVDYINADTINVPVWIQKELRTATGELKIVPLSYSPGSGFEPGSENFRIERGDKPPEDEGFEGFNVPVYVGIGLRVSATVNVTKANANLGGIGIIGAEAEAEKLHGSLVVQTLGVNGKSIASALPIQSELNRTTAQNAITAISSIKALLYSDDVSLCPRIVGLYLPFPGGKPLVNALISELSKKPAVWERTCTPAPSTPNGGG